MPDQTPLQAALTEACEFARAHGLEHPVTPADFGIQRSEAGVTNATYVDADFALVVHVDRLGESTIGLAQLSWLHWPGPDGTEDCKPECGICLDCGSTECVCPEPKRDLPVIDVYLPGDEPAVTP